MSTAIRTWSLLAAIHASGCLGGAVEPPPPPTGRPAIRIDGGDNQVGPEFGRLPSSLVIKVVDAGDGTPRKGTTVRFEIESGGGRLEAAPGKSGTGGGGALESETDAQGNAFADLVLGPAGRGSIKATMPFSGVSNFERFTATAHGAPAVVVMNGGEGQTGEVGTELSDRLSVKITDAAGIQIPAMRVWFRPQDAGEPIDGEVATSSNSGVSLMTARWRLGPAPGPQRLTASVLVGSTGATLASLSGNPITFTASATPAAPRTVTRNPSSFPATQSGEPGRPVPAKPSVLVTSGAGQPMPGVSVRFEVTAGGGNLGGGVTIFVANTNAAGTVTAADWILGGLGTNTVTATVAAPGVSGNPVTFSATAELPGGNLLANPSFEDDVTQRVLPTAIGTWGGDFVTSVARPVGFGASDGANVLQFVATGATAASTNTVASEVFQLVDVSRFAPDIDADRIAIEGAALFARVDAPDVDRLFGLQLLAFSGEPSEFPTKFANASWLGRARVDRVVDLAGVWQSASGSLTLPRNTRFVAIHVFAFEDVVNDGAGTPEFAGHYADGAMLKVVRLGGAP